MKQMTLAAVKGFQKHNRATRQVEFLARMDALMPWAEFCALIEPHYPKAGNGRPPVGVERMLRMYCVANFALPDALVQHVYGQYLIALEYQVKVLAAVGFTAEPQDSIGLLRLVKSWFRGALRQSWLGGLKYEVQHLPGGNVLRWERTTNT